MAKSDDIIFMHEVIELAKKGMGQVSPNPLVGAIVVKDNEVIGRGYHEKYGQAHAEVNAINNSIKSVEGATVYCNLEPCCHYKKQTPPCAQMLISKKIKKVVICTLDPNPLVSGKGVLLLRSAGIEVEVGILEFEAKVLNEVFFHNIKTNMPFTHIKLAQTLDGKIATYTGDSKWISNDNARTEVHQLRLKYDAVMIGRNTLVADNARLNIRMNIDSKGKQPYRIIIGQLGKMDLNLNIFNDKFSNKNIIVTTQEHYEKLDDKIVNTHKKLGTQIILYSKNDINPLKNIFLQLNTRGVKSILIEGGARLITDTITNNLATKYSFYICPILLGSGLSYFNTENIESMKSALSFGKSYVRDLDGQAVMDIYSATPLVNMEAPCSQA